MTFTALEHVATPVLDIAYERAGDPSGIPVVLLNSGRAA